MALALVVTHVVKNPSNPKDIVELPGGSLLLGEGQVLKFFAPSRQAAGNATRAITDLGNALGVRVELDVQPDVDRHYAADRASAEAEAMGVFEKRAATEAEAASKPADPVEPNVVVKAGSVAPEAQVLVDGEGVAPAGSVAPETLVYARPEDVASTSAAPPGAE